MVYLGLRGGASCWGGASHVLRRNDAAASGDMLLL
jgi:hypothetical protein